MKTDLNKKDDFYELLQSQKLQEVPPMLELNIMQKVQPAQNTKSSLINIQSVIVFGLLLSLYALTSLILVFFFPSFKFLADLKSVLFVCMILQIAYELNEFFSEIFLNKKIGLEI